MNTNPNHRIGIYAALLLIAGIVLSGPLGLVVVTMLHPQPAWHDAQTQAANYHPIQILPFFGGFLLVLGSGLLITTLYQLSAEKDKAIALLAVVCTALIHARARKPRADPLPPDCPRIRRWVGTRAVRPERARFCRAPRPVPTARPRATENGHARGRSSRGILAGCSAGSPA